MNIKAIRSDGVYAKIMSAPDEKKNDIYRYELMKPFEKKWACYNVPMKAAVPNGYDVIMASSMLGHLAPANVDRRQSGNVRRLSDDALWDACANSIERALRCFEESGIELPVQEYLFTILLANPQSPYITLSEGYCGEGGIPGYLSAWLIPSHETIRRLPAAFAHEANHNVRFQFIQWKNDITLGEMLVSEGLAENFATWLYGEDLTGPWITKTDWDTLHDTIKPVICEGLQVQGLADLSAYLYGDEMAKLQNYAPVGLPYCAGYACGYYLVKHYLRKTNKTIVEATLTPGNEILKATEDFWHV